MFATRNQILPSLMFVLLSGCELSKDSLERTETQSEDEIPVESKNPDESSSSQKQIDFERSLLRWETFKNAHLGAYRYKVKEYVPDNFERPFCIFETTLQVYDGVVNRREVNITRGNDYDENHECPQSFVEEGIEVGESEIEGVAPPLTVDDIYVSCHEEVLGSDIPPRWDPDGFHTLEECSFREDGILYRCGWANCDDGGCDYGSPYYEIEEIEWLPPQGTFGCGDNTCNRATEFCETISTSESLGSQIKSDQKCEVLPEVCVVERTCDCILLDHPTCRCEIDNENNIRLECSGQPR